MPVPSLEDVKPDESPAADGGALPGARQQNAGFQGLDRGLEDAPPTPRESPVQFPLMWAGKCNHNGIRKRGHGQAQT